MARNENIKSLTPTGKINFMLYGPPGVGKTTLLGGGGKTLIVRPPTDHVDSIREGSSAQEWIVETWDDMTEVEEFLRHNPREFTWVWVDSISLLQDHLLDDVFRKMNAHKPHRIESALIDQGEYGNNFTRIKSWVRSVVGIPGFNFGMTAHPMDVFNPSTGEVKAGPWVQGKNMSFTICGYMNAVAYMESVKQGDDYRRVLRFAETEDYVAKDQKIFNFPNFRLSDPTMAKLMKAAGAASSTKPTATRGGRRVVRRK